MAAWVRDGGRLLVVGLLGLALGLVLVPAVQAARSAPLFRETSRIAGADRFETAIAVSRTMFPTGAKKAYLATAELTPDALVGARLPSDGPLLLVPSCGTIPISVAAELGRLGVEDVVAIGGPAAVGEEVLTQAQTGVIEWRERCPGEAGPALDGKVGLDVRRYDLPDGSFLQATVRNGLDETIDYGRGLIVERRQPDGTYEAVETGPVTDERLTVASGTYGPTEVVAPFVRPDGTVGDLEPGTYRLTKRTSAVTLMVELAVLK